MKNIKLKKTTPTAIPKDSIPYWEYFGKDKAGKFPVAGDDGYAVWKDYNSTPTDLPIAYYETYDESKIKSGYLTAFSDTRIVNALYYKLGNGTIVRIPNTNYKPDGEILRVYVKEGTTLYIERQNQPTITYKPIIKSYVYWNTDIHSFNVDEEKFWTLTISKTLFGENKNVLNVRIASVDTNNGGHLRNSFVSTWELDSNDNLIVRVYMKNTLGEQLNVINVSLIIQTI